MGKTSKLNLIILCIFIVLSIDLCCAEVSDVSVSRTIIPNTISPGDSFDVSVEVIIGEGDGAIFGTLSEKYTAFEKMQDWEISNIDADSVFSAYKDNENGMYEWSSGMRTIPTGTYSINYCITVPENTDPGTYSIEGRWLDADHPGWIEVTGSNDIILKSSSKSTETSSSDNHLSEQQNLLRMKEASQTNMSMDVSTDDVDSERVIDNEIRQSTYNDNDTLSIDNEVTEQEQQSPGFSGILAAFALILYSNVHYFRTSSNDAAKSKNK
nr:hypothetical protein [uncultured Methanolobus sp.]